MKAIEFTTKPKDGVIEIPKQYLGNLSNEIRVIILINSEMGAKQKKKANDSLFSSLRVKTKGLKVDRDEIYKR